MRRAAAEMMQRTPLQTGMTVYMMLEKSMVLPARKNPAKTVRMSVPGHFRVSLSEVNED